MKRTPTGYVARCQCGALVGAMDRLRTPANDAGKILGAWLSDGYTIEPRFSDNWDESLEACRCDPLRPATMEGATLKTRLTVSNDSAPWLTTAHSICADAGIPPGHIDDRLTALRDMLEAMRAPEGYALIAIDVLRAWGKLDEVKAACVFPVAAPEAMPVQEPCADGIKELR